jgi:hypothetical protein
VVPQASATIVMHVSLPPGSAGHSLQAFADGHAVPSHVVNGLVEFTLPVTAGQAANWAVEAD